MLTESGILSGILFGAKRMLVELVEASHPAAG
jgi:hypothetical protein